MNPHRVRQGGRGGLKCHAQLDHRQADLGDFQTPRELVDEILHLLGPTTPRWTRVLEPSCGRGAFLRALLEQAAAPRELIGIEIQQAYWNTASSLAGKGAGSRVEILHANLFDLDLRTALPWRGRGPLLVLGNPPWITASALGKLESGNAPTKRNLKGLPGIEALTGSSNFDLAEAVWIKLLEELAEEQPTIALLCKISTARAVLELRTAGGWRLPGRRSTRSMPRAGSAPRWAPAC